GRMPRMENVDFWCVGQIIANKRRTRRLQGAQVARAVGIHPVTLSRIEHGKLPGVTFAVLARLACYLDISLDHLVEYYRDKRLRESRERAKRAYDATGDPRS